MANDTQNLTSGAGINPQYLADTLNALIRVKAQQAFPMPPALSAGTYSSPASSGVTIAPGVTVLPPASPFPSTTAAAPTPSGSPFGILPSVSPSGNMDSDEAMKQALLKSTEYGQQATQEQIERARILGDQVPGLIRQQANIPIPPMGHQWHVGTWTDPQGNVHKQGFLKNLMNVLGMVGSATRPGRAIEEAYYGPGIRRYEAEAGAKAKLIEEIQKQQEREQQPIPSTAGMVYHPIMAGARLISADAGASRAETAKKSLENKINVDAQRIQQGWANLDFKGKQLAATQMYHNAYLQAYNYRTEAMKEEVGAQNLTREQIAQAEMEARSMAIEAMAQNGFVKDHLFAHMFGVSPDMAAPSVPNIPGTSVQNPQPITPSLQARPAPKRPKARPQAAPAAPTGPHSDLGVVYPGQGR